MDAFELLGLPRRAWLEPAEVQARFRERAAALHPDSTAGADPAAFADLQRAAGLLADPVRRLRHLAELQGAPPSDAAPLPPGLADLGFRASGQLHAADTVARQLADAPNALARALVLPQALEAREACEALLAEVGARTDAVRGRLERPDIETDPAALRTAADELIYLQRWETQARALLLRLG